MTTLRETFVSDLKTIYDAEFQIIDAFEKMIRAAKGLALSIARMRASRLVPKMNRFRCCYSSQTCDFPIVDRSFLLSRHGKSSSELVSVMI